MTEPQPPNDFASLSDRQLVQILAEEHADSPWDDRRISTLLGNRGIPLGPRSVGRYRQRLDIPSSSDRRRWDPATRDRELERLRTLVGLNGQGQGPLPKLSDPATEDTGPIPVTRDPGPPEPDDSDSVLFSSDPVTPEAARIEELKRFLSSNSSDLLSGERTLSNIPAILRELLTPTPASSGGSRLQMPPAPQARPGSPVPDPLIQDPPGDELSAWEPYLEFHSKDRGIPEPDPAAKEPRDEWRELSAEGFQAPDPGDGQAEDGALLERLFPGGGTDPSTLPEKHPDAASSEMFLFLDEDEDPARPPQAAAPQEPTPPRTPQPPRARSKSGAPRKTDLEDTQVDGGGSGRPRPLEHNTERRLVEATQRAWSELWPFPKYRQLVEDIPVLARLKLRRSTVLLRPLLAARLREAHRVYLGGEPAPAAAILEPLIQCRSNSIRFWARLLLGEIRLVHDLRLPEARVHLTEAVRMSSRPGRAHLLLAITLYLQDELEEACEMLQTSRSAVSPSTTARLVLGLTFLEMGELTRGLAELEAARKRIQFPQELNERLRHAREILKAGLWSPNRPRGGDAR